MPEEPRADTPAQARHDPNHVEVAPEATTFRRLIHRRRAKPWFHKSRRKYPWLDPVLRWTIAFVAVLLIIGGLLIGWLPGPGGFIAVIGVAMLAAEFRWARRLTRQAQAIAHRWHVRVTGRKPRWAWRWKKKMNAAVPG